MPGPLGANGLLLAMADTSSAATGTAAQRAAAPSGRQSGGGRLPIAFVPNAGPHDSNVRFQARGLSGHLLFGAGELSMALRTPTRDKTPKDTPANPRRHTPKNIPATLVQLRWIGAQPTAQVTGTLHLPGRANVFIGNDPSKWRTNLPMYAGMTISQLYDGIDLHYTGTEGQLKATYVVAPGADPGRIRWRYQGADSVSVDASGNLVVHLPAPASTVTDTEVLSSTLTELAPVASQTIDEREVAVPVRFAVGPDGSVSFALGAYDPTQPLIIDPTLLYATYLGSGGVNEDVGTAIAVDAGGNSYITGAFNGSTIVDKLNPTGSALLYTTSISANAGEDIALDSAGNAYVAGYTTSTNLATTAGVIRGSHTTADGEALVAKLNSAGTALSYLTYLGGNQYDSGEAIAVDGAGNAYLAGDSLSSNLATPGATQTSYSGSQTAAFAARLASSARINQYSYDGLQRLVGALESPGASYAYGYDAAGNRTSLTVNGTIITTTYNLANQVTNAGYMY